GLGEVVVAGRVIPDHFRMDASGNILEQVTGVKKVALRTLPDGGTEETEVPPERVEAPSLDGAALSRLNELATTCEEVFGPGRDIEWAVADGDVYLLQCRAITRAGSSGATARPTVAPPEVVTSVPFFEGVDADEVERISSMFKHRRFSAGETITKEGAGGAAFYVIDSGEAVVTSGGKELNRLGHGDYFGEVALIDNGARSATVTAATEVECFGLTFWEFRPLVQQNATIAWNLLQTLAARLRTARE
ncbi:MAG: cyclic nucleotide-binding domain-containing protein, partial [Actinobacteria bacterium]|nr:cyclic nucleotide-binding domain-containing protein [Actinomycetota bacterium]NIS29842.1 cyclic nucleotide-binding domain-containing protein [Actinomycetota bacterium]NIT94737.1 cyclic nucleotide-binding domain-containing protein [Actinomycetota bacterium]NIU18373.1 cyclic nucleotide-binding domain-containing protein [Actinomycetota bacterium]NIU65142.1 cyclic nucleotide-binding domain-containing protein [Actinomycetota bacterium]